MSNYTPSQTAYDVDKLTLGFPTTTDLSTDANCFVAFAANGAGGLVLCGAGGQAIGVQMTDFPGASSSNVVAQSVRILGVAKVIAGGNLEQGQLVMSDASGHAVVAAGNTTAPVGVCGIALDNASSGVLVPVLLTPGAGITGTAL